MYKNQSWITGEILSFFFAGVQNSVPGLFELAS